MQINTINQMFFASLERSRPAAMLTRQGLAWVPISSQELYRKVVGVAQALTSWGIAQGDRVAILSENRPEWAIADFAIMLLGAVGVPLYPTLGPEQLVHMIRDSGARVIFVSTLDQRRKIDSIR